jgi:multisubunit Na+/H+ antiporter MnhG subunit
MTAGQVVTGVLLTAGVLVAVASAVGALLMRDALDRLHFLSPVTSLAAPLVWGAMAVENGWNAATAGTLLTVFLLALSGPVLGSATGRLVAQRQGRVPEEEAG